MKRSLSALVLLLALGLLFKLVGKGNHAPEDRSGPVLPLAASTEPLAPSHASLLAAKYPDEAELIERIVARYEQTAARVEAEHGLGGLRLLDRLDLEAIFLLEKHPGEFRALAASLGDDAAANLLLHWREYFGLKRADDVDRAQLVADLARLPAARRRLAAKYPMALPLILSAGDPVCNLIRRREHDPDALHNSLAMLSFISLEHGPDDLKHACATLDRFPGLALEAFRLRGPEGFALVAIYGPILDSVGPTAPLDALLIVLQVNSDDFDDLTRSWNSSQSAALLRHLAARGLLEAAGSSPHGVRLAAEYGSLGEQALEHAGGDAADVVYERFLDPTLRRAAVDALARHGPMAAAMLYKYAGDPDFQFILKRDGAAVIPPVARADISPEVLLALQQKPLKSFTENLAQQVLAWSGENGQAAIRTIRHDGLKRLAELQDTDLQIYHFLPLYDLLHLAGVMAGGHAPTSGELAWATLDAAFVVWDVVTLTAAQPQAAAAGEVVRAELKANARETIRATAREAAEHAAHAASREGVRGGASGTSRLARWWTVRSAGGLFAVLKRAPEALASMTVDQVARLATPLCRKAGLRLSAWAPMRFFKDGAGVVLRVPPQRWGKYVAANFAQAGVGVVAMAKMEEYLASRRPPGDSSE